MLEIARQGFYFGAVAALAVIVASICLLAVLWVIGLFCEGYKAIKNQFKRMLKERKKK